LESATAADPAALRPDEKAALEEIQRKTGDGAELICIIRSRTNPLARSEIIVLDRVSPAFIQRLTTEQGHGRSSHEANAGSHSPPSDLSPPAGNDPQGLRTQNEAPLHETSATDGPDGSPEADWHPRWLERGYQGS
jgi:hypothetical protein